MPTPTVTVSSYIPSERLSCTLYREILYNWILFCYWYVGERCEICKCCLSAHLVWNIIKKIIFLNES